MGVTTPDRIFMRIGNFTFKVRQGEFSDNARGEGDPSKMTYTEAGDLGIKPIWLGFTKMKGKFYVELTGLTGLELDAFEKGIAAAIAAAREVVTYLDENASTTYDDDTPLVALRGLRPPPIVIHREIRPFIGTDVDPVEKEDLAEYDAAYVD